MVHFEAEVTELPYLSKFLEKQEARSPHFVQGLVSLQKDSHCAISSQFPHFVLIFYAIFLKN